jgi:hypothetical protein
MYSFTVEFISLNPYKEKEPKEIKENIFLSFNELN